MMEDIVIGLPWYSPQAWNRLKELTAAAGVSKNLGSHEDFLAGYERARRKYEQQGKMTKPIPIDVGVMAEWLEANDLEINAAGREQYALSLAGVDGRPYRTMRRNRQLRKRCAIDGVEYRSRRGTLCCWQDGTTNRWG